VLKEKKHNDRLHNDVEDMDEMPTGNGLNQDTALDVTQAIQRLGITYKQVITMQLEGFSQQEIASVLGINEAAVAKRSSRARLLLEQWLKE
jgi:DNA-directed RNA polymerase specialized sigma24 family protein